jgi:hypothetical protein
MKFFCRKFFTGTNSDTNTETLSLCVTSTLVLWHYLMRASAIYFQVQVLRTHNSLISPTPYPGDIYEGEWANGQIERHGTAKMSYYHGLGEYDVYEGEFSAEGNRHGFGKMAYGHGHKKNDVYEGHWAEGNRHGFGKMTYENGVVYEGNW